jgi:hypothetical protein
VTRRWCLLIALAVAACGPRVPASTSPTPTTPGMCQIGPDDGPAVADRGIGGTGIDDNAIQTADRGIGGTGIVGVITGFSSVCVDGLEVSYGSTTTVSMAGSSPRPSTNFVLAKLLRSMPRRVRRVFAPGISSSGTKLPALFSQYRPMVC